ncbi:MAG TPA: 5'-nucleotidase C-terminal domain-containing protein [Candidatus Limnocylindrales bacterium]|nr:5'-nucleotidase C-terminal domain-containing protein [Candidatus Limnocylindrales bacterium]
MRFHVRSVWLLCILLFAVPAGARHHSFAAPAQSANHVTITLLSTTDIHGHIEPWDYYANKPADLGLAKIATLIKRARAEAPHALLLDCGDTTQGTPLAYYFAEKDTSKPNPTIAAFNLLHYDAMAVGNHEFNFGEKEMWKAKSESDFPWLAANIKQSYTSGVPHIGSYIIKNIEGVRVGIVGFVTPGIPRWEIPGHYKGYEFEPIVAAAQRVIPEVRKRVDLLVVIMHSGLDRDPQTGASAPDQLENENAAWELANDVPGIDVIFYGHTHREMPQLMVHGVLLSQARNWGQSLARADVEMSRDASGRWSVESKHSTTIPVTADVPADPEIMKLAEPYQEATQKYLDTPIADSEKEMTGELARYQDDPLVDLIHKVQLEAGHADVSMATMFFPGVKIPAGPVTVRQATALYVYENTLYVVEMTGAQLKDALEHAASFFPAWPVPEGETIRLPGYNADCAEGVSYEIDLTQPVGQRIRNLAFHGKPLDPAQKLRVAINNYRYTGGGRYSVYQGLPVVYRSPVEIRELLIDYLSRTKKIPATADGNWKIVPLEAQLAIERAALEMAPDHGR